MAFENVRPFRLDTSGFDNALSGLFGGIKQRNDQAEFDAGTVGLIDTLMPNQNALSQPTMAPMQPQQPAVLQAGYGRESGPGMGGGTNLVENIKGFEGYTPKAAWDYKQNSVGYGTRAKYPGEVIDKPEAERRLQSEVGNARQIVEQFAPNAPPGVKDALTSLTYNAGADWTRSGLGMAVKAGNYDEAARRFVQYNKAGGKTLPGLVNRRQQEVQWFNGGNGQPVQTADAGGNQQTAVLEWARRNPRHPTAQAILQKYTSKAIEQQFADPSAAEMRDLELRGKRADVAKAEREAQGGGQFGVFKDAKQKADVEEGMRKEITSVGKAYSDVRDAYARVRQSSETPSPAGDLALIFNYMKMLDPGSVVREAEFATAAQSGSFGDVIKAQVERIMSGQRLAPNMRADFVFQAEGLMKKQERQFQAIQNQYKGIAERSGVDTSNVILDMTSPDAAAADAPRLQFPLNDRLPSGEYVWNPATGRPERK